MMKFPFKMKDEVYYIAIIEKKKYIGNYKINFPKFSTCQGIGDNFKHAKEVAKEKLKLHIKEMKKKNKPLPKPSTYDEAKELLEEIAKDYKLKYIFLIDPKDVM